MTMMRSLRRMKHNETRSESACAAIGATFERELRDTPIIGRLLSLYLLRGEFVVRSFDLDQNPLLRLPIPEAQVGHSAAHVPIILDKPTADRRQHLPGRGVHGLDQADEHLRSFKPEGTNEK
mgnify:CR=1 FL=1